MQNEMLELKSTITKIKNLPEEFKSRFDQAEEYVNFRQENGNY